MWPTVIRKQENGAERAFDLPSCLLNDRIILMTEEIRPDTAASIIAQLLYLQAENPKKPISIYINSPGGSVTDGFGIYDTIKSLSCPVNTIATGMAASMAAFLLCAGDKGKRYATPNSTIMIHQPLGGVQGQATDIEIHARRIIELKQRLYDIMSEHTGKTPDEIAQACERDNYLTAEQALEFGLIDKIIAPGGKK